MTSTSFLADIELLIRSRHAIIFIETTEKARAQSLLLHVADRMRLPFFVWTRTKGLRMHYELAASKETMSAINALHEAERQHRKAIYNFQGLGDDLEDRVLATKLRDAAQQFYGHEGSIIITGQVPDELPNVIKPLTTILRLPLPSPGEYRTLAQDIYRDLSKKHPIEFRMTKQELAQVIHNLRGLTLIEAEKILTKVMLEDKVFSRHDIHGIIDAKKSIIEQTGLLEYYPHTDNLTQVAGLNGLKTWLEKRRAIIQHPENARQFGLEFPRGVLLLGVQGAGKSLCAKAVAADWGLPLLKMDPAGLYNKFIGESEKNFKRATQAAEMVAPVVLWIDEIEKAFASGGDMDGGVSQRVMGLFLSWLQESTGDVFVVATANDISKLPPELLRKGRFDEIFFVDLPDETTRKHIFEIHLTKRQRSANDFDLARLAAASAGFSGAEIEQVIVSGLYSAFANAQALNTEVLLQEINATRPLSVTMQERLRELRNWALERTVSAH